MSGLDLTKPVQTRGGLEAAVTIFNLDSSPGRLSLGGWIIDENGIKMMWSWYASGRNFPDHDSIFDLINVPDRTEALRAELSVYERSIKWTMENGPTSNREVALFGLNAAADALRAEIERLTPKVPKRQVRYLAITNPSYGYSSKEDAQEHNCGFPIATVTWDEPS